MKKSIIEVEKNIKDANNKIEVIQSECSHEDISVTDYGTADCNICGKSFNWYCPNSPTLECDYEQDDGGYNDEYCIYCGEPEERK